MPRRTEARPESRSFSFRMPRDLFDDLSAIAKWRGVDVSALLNWILAEYRPLLLKKRAEQEAATLQACEARVWAKKPSTAEALQSLRGLLRTMQDEYARLSRQALDEDERAGGVNPPGHAAPRPS